MKGKLCVRTSKSSDEVLSMIRTITFFSEKFKYLLYLDDCTILRYTFYGKIMDNKFMIVPAIVGKNIFTPLMIGEVKHAGEGSLIYIQIKNSPVMRFLNIGIIIFAITAVLFLLYEVIDHSFLLSPYYQIFALIYGVVITILNNKAIDSVLSKQYLKLISCVNGFEGD